MQDFKKLMVWQKSHEVALAIYRLSNTFPADERFGLTSQIRRAASSIPTNIAEGSGRGSNADFARFLQISMGSASELEYQLILAKDLGYIPLEIFAEINSKLIETKRMLNSFLKKVRG